MTCSSCRSPMFIVLMDRAFCENCYYKLQNQQRQLVENFPRKQEPLSPAIERELHDQRRLEESRNQLGGPACEVIEPYDCGPDRGLCNVCGGCTGAVDCPCPYP